MKKMLYLGTAFNVYCMQAASEGASASASIIDPKYRGKAKTIDWFTTFLDSQITTAIVKTKKVKAEDGTESIEEYDTGKRSMDLDKLFDLAKANAIDTASMEAQRDRPNAPGRIRMTLGNSLRAAARKRHGLNDVTGEFVEADAAFIGDSPKTHNPDGSKIVVAKAPAEESTEA